MRREISAISAHGVPHTRPAVWQKPLESPEWQFSALALLGRALESFYDSWTTSLFPKISSNNCFTWLSSNKIGKLYFKCHCACQNQNSSWSLNPMGLEVESLDLFQRIGTSTWKEFPAKNGIGGLLFRISSSGTWSCFRPSNGRNPLKSHTPPANPPHHRCHHRRRASPIRRRRPHPRGRERNPSTIWGFLQLLPTKKSFDVSPILCPHGLFVPLLRCFPLFTDRWPLCWCSWKAKPPQKDSPVFVRWKQSMANRKQKWAKIHK